MFTENQVRQFYVIPTGNADTTNVKQPTKIVPGTSGSYPADLKALAAGACQFVVAPKGDEAYFLYKGPSDDGLQRSDLIKKCNVMSVKLTDALDLSHPVKKAQVVVASELLNSTNLAAGGDFVLNVSIRNFMTGDYNSTKVKFGAARVASGSAASDLYKKLAISLAKNFAREPIQYVKILLKNSSTPVEVKPSDTLTSLTSTTATGIIIQEVEQPWRRGAAPQEFVDFAVEPTTIYNGSDDVVWGTVTDVTVYDNTNGSYVGFPNSKKVADMEWFFHKERGDKYGEMCWPYNIDTKYQVDPANTDGYSFVDIHFYFEGNSHNVGKSEKTLTIVGSKANLKRLIGHAYIAASGNDPAQDATGLYAFLNGTDVTIETSSNW